METNYYEIKMLRLKVIYLLAGWAVFIFAGMWFSFYLLDNYLPIYLLDALGLTSMNIIGLYLMGYGGVLLFLTYILVFTNWIPLRFWETWGLSIVFMLITFLSSTAYYLLNVSFSEPYKYLLQDFYKYLLQDFLCFSIFLLGILSIYQILIFLPVFAIGYSVWVYCLKKRKSCTLLSKRTHGFLYLLNLILILSIVCLIILIIKLNAAA